MPACGPPSSLSPEKQTRSGPGGERSVGRRLAAASSRQHAGAQVVDEREAVLLRDRGELGQRRLLGEADDPEVGLVHAQEQRGLAA